MTVVQKLNREVTHLLAPSLRKAKVARRKSSVTYEELLDDKMLIVEAINSGLPYSLFSLIRSVTPFSSGDWAAFLNLSTKSLLRYQQEAKKFRPLHSEKIIEMAEVAKEGLDVFGDAGKFRLWLDTPNFALGSVKPIELLKNSYGKDLVLGELTRIAHGILV